MKIRSLQIWTKEDLYNEYAKAADGIFDAITLGISVFIESGRKLNAGEFYDACKTTVINKYKDGETYDDYLAAKRSFSALVLPNRKVILTSSTDYTREQFAAILSGQFIAPQAKVKQSNIADFIYNSNKIEGIEVTLNDTTTLLAGGNVPNIKYNDKAAVLNHQDCFSYRLTLTGFSTDPYHLCRMHYELMKGVRSDAGKFRNVPVYIGSASHGFPEPESVHELLKKLPTINSDDALLKASIIHGEMVNIHPFSDGNGRISRLVTYPYTNIPCEDRLEYYQACDAYGAYGSVEPLYNLIYSLNVSTTSW